MKYFIFIFQQICFQLVVTLVLDLAESAYHVPALLPRAFLMHPQEIGVGVCAIAVTAQERSIEIHILMLQSILPASEGLADGCALLILDEIEVFDGAGIKTGPD